MLLFNCPAALRRRFVAGLMGIAAVLFMHIPAGATGIVVGASSATLPARLGAPDGVFERGPLLFDGAASADERIAATLPAWLQFQQADLAGWGADDSLLFDLREGAQRQWYRAQDGAGSQALPSPPGLIGAVPHPYDAHQVLLIVRDPDGSSSLRLEHRDTRAVTPLNVHVAPDSPVLWAHDGRRIAFASNARDGKESSDGGDVDIYTLDTTVAGAQPRLIAGNLGDGTAADADADGNQPESGLAGTGNNTHWQLLDWSQDDGRLLLRRALSADDGTLYSVDTGTGEIRALTIKAAAPSTLRVRADRGSRRRAIEPPAELPVQALTARFVPGDGGIDYIGYGNGDYLRLRRLDPDGTTHDLSPALRHDVRLFDLSANGRYLAYVYDDDGLSHLVLLDPHGDPLRPADVPPGVIRSMRFDRAGRRLALAIDSTRSPRAVYVLDTQTRTAARWTPTPSDGVDTARFVMPALLHFPTWDSDSGGPRQLSAYVYRPSGTGRHPVLLWLHDGPTGSWHPGFNSLLQYFVGQLGFVVIAPDVRGSGGYGRAFAALADGRLRADAARDIGALLVWIGVQPDLDSAHVVALGQGYGGYLVLQTLVQYGSRVAAGIDLAGPSDLVSWLEDTAAPQRYLLRTQLGDERDIDMRAFLRSVSPLTAASGIHQPLLIVQGSFNREVPPAESEQLLARLRSYHADAGCITVRDAGADLDDSAGRDGLYAALAGFLERVANSNPASVPLTAPVQTAATASPPH